jgi:hypothetical protein
VLEWATGDSWIRERHDLVSLAATASDLHAITWTAASHRDLKVGINAIVDTTDEFTISLTFGGTENIHVEITESGTVTVATAGGTQTSSSPTSVLKPLSFASNCRSALADTYSNFRELNVVALCSLDRGRFDLTVGTYTMGVEVTPIEGLNSCNVVVMGDAPVRSQYFAAAQ